MSEGLHNGHRERIKQEFLKNGFNSNTPEHKMLEMLLFYSIPRKDTNNLAHELINGFGGIKGVLDAAPDALKAVPGVTDNTVTLLKLIMPFARAYVSEKHFTDSAHRKIDNVYEFLLDKYLGYNREVFAITSFDSSGKFLGFDVVSDGNIGSVNVPLRDVMEIVIKRNASCIIMSHNHPNGFALPSEEDVAITKMVQGVLDTADARLLDHVIIAGNDYVSMVQSQCFKHIFNKN